ncbi:MAG: PQQ-dependent sugar dehydrogenase [Acidobacteriota bacterium]
MQPAQEPVWPVIGPRPPHQPDDTFRPEVAEVQVEVFLSGLEIPWSMVFAPDGRILISERPGRIRMVRQGQLESQPYATFPVYHRRGREAGLMGLALPPDFPSTPYVYVMYSYNDDEGRIINRVSRIHDHGSTGSQEEVLLDGIIGGRAHDGGRIAFGPDGKLYVGTGEAFQKDRAQEMADLGGKILRLNPDGSIPDDNPFPGSPIFSPGHRNVQGLAWQPRTGALFNSEHGPSGERWPQPDGSTVRTRNRDEVNVIAAGDNAGWPHVVGYGQVEGYVDPILMWPEAAVPLSGMTFYTGDLMPELEGDLFIATLASEALLRIRFQDPDDPYRPTRVERWFARSRDRFSGGYGRLRDVVQGPDGALYVLTNNLDGRRRAGTFEGDDRVLRIVPAATGK